MYANAEIQYAGQERDTTAVVRPTAPRSRISFRATVTRFLNWFGGGSIHPHMIKADQPAGTGLMLIHGHILPNPSCREETGADKYTR